ncbi:TPA: ABC transporter permease [bacterium]|jgi:peptide/nickel transport system permease protein|nr:ABC transporter permease [bacterium]
MRRLFKVFRNKAALAGLLTILFFIFIAVFAEFIAPYSPYEQNLADRLQPPSKSHLLGTDDLGRDILSRIIYGARISLAIGLISVALALGVGISAGLVSAYYGGIVDTLLMRLFDVMLAFPTILLAMAIMAALGPDLENAMIAVGIVNIPTFARIVRASALIVKEQEYVMAAQALGQSNSKIIFRHILPNIVGPITVQVTLSYGGSILNAAGLGFLGMGAQPPTPEWGAMLSQARSFIISAPWTVTFPGIAIFLSVLGFNILGDGLRDFLDPRLR